jgi:AcrR family transcriptional regulator
MAAHLTAFVDTVRAAADRHEDPVRRFWAAMRAYMATFEEQPNAARLWFAYWLDSGQRSRTRPLDEMHREVTALLAELLAPLAPITPTAPDDAQARAHALLSYLLGAVVQQAVQPLPFPALATEIAGLCGIGIRGIEPGEIEPAE